MSADNIASLIFPQLLSLPQSVDDPMLLRDIMAQIHNDPAASATFHALSSSEQEAFLGFCLDNRGLKITYDPFFQYLFHPDHHPERLDRLLSCILEQTAHLQEVLPRERTDKNLLRRLSEYYGCSGVIGRRKSPCCGNTADWV